MEDQIITSVVDAVTGASDWRDLLVKLVGVAVPLLLLWLRTKVRRGTLGATALSIADKIATRDAVAGIVRTGVEKSEQAIKAYRANTGIVGRAVNKLRKDGGREVAQTAIDKQYKKRAKAEAKTPIIGG